MKENNDASKRQIDAVLQAYPGLNVSESNIIQDVLCGTIMINCEHNGYQLCKDYDVRIVVPKQSDALPSIYDTGEQISRDYPHRYTDGRLCLDTDTAIRVRFIDGFYLPEWMTEYVEPYFFSYEYYMRYNEFPFGDREHSIFGILQTYGEFFCEDKKEKTFRILRAISENEYRGHLACPCGSGQKARNCHGKNILRFYTDERLRRIARADYQGISEDLKEYDKQQRNSKRSERKKDAGNSICSKRKV